MYIRKLTEDNKAQITQTMNELLALTESFATDNKIPESQALEFLKMAYYEHIFRNVKFAVDIYD